MRSACLFGLTLLLATTSVHAGCSAGSDDDNPQTTTSSTSSGGGAGGSSTSSGTGGSGGVVFTGGSGGGVDPCAGGGPPGPGCDCEQLVFTIDTQQACAMSILDGFEMDGEGFITVQNQQHRVFAIDRWGAGHIIGWCDATTLPQLLAAFDVRGYLGQVPDARVASFGDEYLCQPGGIPGNPLPAWIEYQGFDLPALYQGNSAQLANDWDAIIFCGFRQGWPYDWVSEIGDFVANRGKGFLAVMDYEGVVTQIDFTNMSNITSPAGIVFDPLNLPWSPASASVALDCVPDIPPPN